MFIKTRSEIMGNTGYDNTYPNIAKVYNDVTFMSKFNGRTKVLAELVDTMTLPKFSKTYTDVDFKFINKSFKALIRFSSFTA